MLRMERAGAQGGGHTTEQGAGEEVLQEQRSRVSKLEAHQASRWACSQLIANFLRGKLMNLWTHCKWKHNTPPHSKSQLLCPVLTPIPVFDL